MSTKKYLDLNGALYLWGKIKALLDGKVDKVEGKQLSTEDYTSAEKTKLAGIAENANKTVITNTLTSDATGEALSAAQGKALATKINELDNKVANAGYGDMLMSTYDADKDGKVDTALHADTADNATSAANATKAADADKLGGKLPTYYAPASSIPTVPTLVSAFENDKGYITEHQDISGKLDKTGDASSTTVTFAPASTRENVATGDKMNVIIGKIAKMYADLKAVAFSGSYNDLTDKPSIPVVTNDLTDDLKAHYDAAYTHSTQAHAPANAQENVIESVKVNGVAVTPDAKAVSIIVPTTVAQLSDAADYAKKADLTNVYKYKGSVANFAALPASDNVAGDVYNTEDTGMNYAWNGEAWDNLGEIFEIVSITNADIDQIVAAA